MEHIYTSIVSALHTLVPFLIVLGVVVFVHEFGHFIIARLCGVKIETFSIGFGKELFGWLDRYGTRWRVALLPLGGYVKMFGDADPSSFGPDEKVKDFTNEEKKVAFYSQRLAKRFAIVAAGPAFNYFFAIIALAALFLAYGQPYASTIVDKVVENSAAQEAGLQPQDKILSIDGARMDSFEDIRRAISLNSGVPIEISLERGGVPLTLTAKPRLAVSTDRLGGEHTTGQLGIISTATEIKHFKPLAAVAAAGKEVWNISAGTLKGVGQIIMGIRESKELGGPLRIAEMSGKVAQDGAPALIWFIAIISVNLGLINLFPIPLLDGGHLVFYLVEGMRGRPVSERVQDWSFKAGGMVVLFLMLFATWNDLVHLQVVSFIRGLFS